MAEPKTKQTKPKRMLRFHDNPAVLTTVFTYVGLTVVIYEKGITKEETECPYVFNATVELPHGWMLIQSLSEPSVYVLCDKPKAKRMLLTCQTTDQTLDQTVFRFGGILAPATSIA